MIYLLSSLQSFGENVKTVQVGQNVLMGKVWCRIAVHSDPLSGVHRCYHTFLVVTGRYLLQKTLGLNFLEFCHSGVYYRQLVEKCINVIPPK